MKVNKEKINKELVQYVYLLLTTSYFKETGSLRYSTDITTLGTSLAHDPRTIDLPNFPEIQ